MNDELGLSTTAKFEVKDYVRIFFRRKGLFMMGFMAVTPLVFPIILGLPNIYRSQTMLLIRDKTSLNLLQGQKDIATPIKERIRTFNSEILSWNSITKAMDAVGLSDQAETPLEMEVLVENIKKNIMVNISSSTNMTDIITISFMHRDPATTQRFLNVLTTNFIEKSLKDQRVEIFAAINFIKEQIAQYADKVKESETKLIEFKKEHMYDLPEQRTTSANTILALEMRKTDISFDLDQLKNEKAILEERIKVMGVKEEKTLTPADPYLDDLVKKKDQLQTQLQNLQMIYTDMHPDLIETKRLIEATEKQIKSRKSQIKEEKIVIENKELGTMKDELSRMNLKIASLEARKRQVERDLRNTKEKLEEMPSLDEKYTFLINENEALKSVYNRLQQQLEATRMTQHVETTEQGVQFEMLEPARLPLKPFKPNRWRILLMGILAGIAVGGGIAFMVEMADHSFRGTEDARLNLPIRVIGVIPSIVTARERRTKRIRNFVFGCLTMMYLVALGVVSAYVWKYYH